MKPQTAGRAGLLLCPACGMLNRCGRTEAVSRRPGCAHCGLHLRARKPHSQSRALALLLAAAILYAPANLLPILETSSPFGSQRDTIMSGIKFLWTGGSWPLALIILIASILIPLAKLLTLGALLFSVHRRWRGARLQRARLYRMLERIGRWSMTDVFVAAVLSKLVQLRGLARISVGPAAIAFGAVVVLTMMATRAFDPRLIWDPETVEA
ncbi:MAG TPA: paraquat-inducible protein A [Polyangia bacterium]|nr:paraquat-inducible protein A [Polyangia bacterium]